jgi:hypothetical protein
VDKRTLLLAGLVFVTLFSTSVFATTRYVATNGTDAGGCVEDACLTVQYAVGRSSSGDTVEVGSGIYVEQVYINKSLNLVGSSGTVIKMPDSGINSYDWNSDNKPLIGIDTTSGVNISNFLLNSTGHDSSGYEGVHYWKSSGNVSHCDVYGFYDGISVNHVWDESYPSHVVVSFNNLYAGSGSSEYDGIICGEMDVDAQIEDNAVYGNANSHFGIQIGYGATGDIKRNRVFNFTSADLYDSVGIMLAGGVNGSEISGNTVVDCGCGIFAYDDIYYGYDGENNTLILNNNISGSEYGIVVEGDCFNTEIHFNNIVGSSLYDAYGEGSSVVDATHNWWGYPSEPVNITHHFDYSPWITGESEDGKVGEVVAGDTVVNEEAHLEVNLSGCSGSGFLGTSSYVGVPYTDTGFELGTGKYPIKYFDVYAEGLTGVVKITMSYADSDLMVDSVLLDESTLNVFMWYDGGWHAGSDAGRDMIDNKVWGTFPAEKLLGSIGGYGGDPVEHPMKTLLSDIGSGTGYFISAIYLPLGNLILYLGVAFAVISIFLALVYVIGRMVE